MAMYALGTLFSGDFSWQGLGNAALDAFLVTSVFLFVSTSINALKYAHRSKPIVIDDVEIQYAQQADFTSESWNKIKTLNHSSDGSTISSMQDGRLIHNGFKTSYKGCGKKQAIPGIGRADCMVGKTIYELKPNNARSIIRGIKQLHRYSAGLGGGYKLVLVLY